jgi:hypothetical protein
MVTHCDARIAESYDPRVLAGFSIRSNSGQLSGSTELNHRELSEPFDTCLQSTRSSL